MEHPLASIPFPVPKDTSRRVKHMCTHAYAARAALAKLIIINITCS